MNPATPTTIQDLPTPSLLLDLDILEGNLDLMQARANALGVRLRPHIKTHKCIEIARLQRDRGAIGITVSTLEEAMAFAAAGFEDITWAFPLIVSRLDEVREMCRIADFAVTLDTISAIEALEASGIDVPVWIKVDCGYGRAGVDPSSEAAVEVARRLADSATLHLRGCLTHAGHTYEQESADAIVAVAEAERVVMTGFGARLRGLGIDPGTLSVGSTPGMSLVSSLEGIDEARPGNYALYDYTQTRLGSCGIERSAASVLSTVVSSQPGRDVCIADAGALVMSKDTGKDRPIHYGRLYENISSDRLDTDLRILSVSQEHARVSASLPVGMKLRIVPNHSCLTVAQFDHFTVVRGNMVIDTWKIWRDRGPAKTSPGGV
jgi:D-serine deaminase-like pyridoxal phosphate-dependent protein